MQRLQTELNIQWKFASQATPSPKAKLTMETLDRNRSDLSYHYDCVIASLKQLNAHSDSARSTVANDNDANGNGGAIEGAKTEPDAKPVDKKVQIDSGNADKKGEPFPVLSIILAAPFGLGRNVAAILLIALTLRKQLIKSSSVLCSFNPVRIRIAANLVG